MKGIAQRQTGMKYTFVEAPKVHRSRRFDRFDTDNNSAGKNETARSGRWVTLNKTDPAVGKVKGGDDSGSISSRPSIKRATPMPPIAPVRTV